MKIVKIIAIAAAACGVMVGASCQQDAPEPAPVIMPAAK